MLFFTENERQMILKTIILEHSKGELLHLKITNKIIYLLIYFCLFVYLFQFFVISQCLNPSTANNLYS